MKAGNFFLERGRLSTVRKEGKWGKLHYEHKQSIAIYMHEIVIIKSTIFILTVNNNKLNL